MREDVIFTPVGAPNEGNPAAVPRERLSAWDADGIVEWRGYREDIADVWARAHIAMLPSYHREGLPTTLLEADGLRTPGRDDRHARLPRGGKPRQEP